MNALHYFYSMQVPAQLLVLVTAVKQNPVRENPQTATVTACAIHLRIAVQMQTYSARLTISH